MLFRRLLLMLVASKELRFVLNLSVDGLNSQMIK